MIAEQFTQVLFDGEVNWVDEHCVHDSPAVLVVELMPYPAGHVAIQFPL
jgi:hypothetical protein